MEEVILKYQSGTVRAQLDKSNKVLLQGAEITLYAGESLALVGETGSGKTMLALSVMKLLPTNVKDEGGKNLFLGEDLSKTKNMRKHLGNTMVYIPQNGLEYLNPSRRVRHHIYDSLKRLGIHTKAMEETALEKLRMAGFASPEEVLDKYPFELSGGMAQRVTIALAACSNARLVIADEPTNGLDRAGRQAFWEMLDRLFPTAARLIITHDMSVAALCQKTMVLCGGRVMEKGMTAEILDRPKHPYTRALVGALVKNGMKETPVLRKEKGECPFYPRCAAVNEKCLTQMVCHREEGREWWCSGV